MSQTFRQSQQKNTTGYELIFPLSFQDVQRAEVDPLYSRLEDSGRPHVKVVLFAITAAVFTVSLSGPQAAPKRIVRR